MDNKNNLITTLKEIIQTAFISFGIFLFVYIFLVQPHRVQGISMQPNFESGELLLTEKISYHFSKPNLNDVIVFQAPIGNKADFIKRIIALPGDTIKLEDGKVIVNGSEVEENYINSKTNGNTAVLLGKDEYFVLGDNRSSSSDSRTFGPIKRSSIKGKVWLIYWPLVKSGSYKGARLVSSAYYSISDRFN
ncbi:signal peptidase I [Candidatus Curtissbacteria bacterium RIFCSPLOWO2_12_FULL_38_9]|uniref:Signal peptidase I n=1 Tax=Candidatus Curtissbacteria bacterium RIFCSPLOWO2_12_FULL_38_9 TaxID=1797735 RepID=A0A1F5IAD5_9BACT|nr:MAG: signal peptidase I [Candidatus Curtissbacteria bacterium RIFCSPLOWO2_12_FULL_38_9]